MNRVQPSEEKIQLRASTDVVFQFPVGYHRLHPDVSLNFQMNRFYNWVGDTQMLDEMRSVVPRIADDADFTREFLALAEHALTSGQWLKGAFYLRAAEFFMFPSDPAKRPTRKRFLQVIKMHYGVTETDHSAIPYVPLHQFYDQIKTLRNVRSLTARFFTRAEQAQNHCQIGNLVLALQVIVGWLDAMMLADSCCGRVSLRSLERS